MSMKFSLPLVGAADSAGAVANWHGWTAAVSASDNPEPLEPQGEYQSAAEDTSPDVPVVNDAAAADRAVELLSPAGGIEAAFAAFHYGADAIYLGLKKFSARAEAENFTMAELDEITAYAHSLEPPRRVFVTINTLIRQDELPELIETLAALSTLGVDAVIVQDLGVYWAVRHHFPSLELHGSTQMAVHNRAGAETLKRLGFTRAVLARELTFEEVRDITATSAIETEVFVHGALCYSYSGLCLFSAQTLGRSGNRGKCAYSCRDTFEVSGAPDVLRDGTPTRRDPGRGFPFSMKDLALPDHIPALRAAGVSCFKIEGRKKSPLYVATTTDYYRKLLAGTLPADERDELEADLHTVFSRPWTRLFVQSHKDKEVADRDTVGHRGALIGNIEAIITNPQRKQGSINSGQGRPPHIRFRTNRPLQQHDGLQIDLPSQGTPFGFAVSKLFIAAPRRQEVFEAPAGAVVEVPLPDDYPRLPVGAPVYCSSSQAVKQAYRFSRPKAGLHRVRRPLDLHVKLTSESLSAEASVRSQGAGVKGQESGVRGQEPGETDADGQTIVSVRHTLPGPFAAAQDSAAMERALHSAFARLGSSPFDLGKVTFDNSDGCFVPVSRLNQLRRDIIDDLEKRLAERQSEWVAQVVLATNPDCRAGIAHPFPSRSPKDPLLALRARGDIAFRWSIKVDRIGYLDAFTEEDWQDVEEVIIDLARDHPRILAEQLPLLAAKIGAQRIRLALPPLTRQWEEKGLLHKIDQLRLAGCNRWEAGNLSAWSYLDLPTGAATPPPLDLAADWSLYVVNRLAARQLLDMGVSRFALSPEDGLENMRRLLAEFGPRAVVIVHQDTPLFLAESCAYANLIGGCPGKANCRFESMEMVSSHGEKVTALDYHCRTIVLNHGPFCLSTRLADLARAGATSLRADFIYRPYQPAEVRDRWRQVRLGQVIAAGHCANFDRGIL